MLDIQVVAWAEQVPPDTKTKIRTLTAPEGFRITGGGGSIQFNPNATGTACIATVTDNIPMPEYGVNGEDAWRFSVIFSNTNRSMATMTIRIICVRELPDPVEEDPPS